MCGERRSCKGDGDVSGFAGLVSVMHGVGCLEFGALKFKR